MNFPRCLTLWRAGLLGSSDKGNEFFMRHLLGVGSLASAEECGPGERPSDVAGRAPAGKRDVLTAIDFRMTNTACTRTSCCPRRTTMHDFTTTGGLQAAGVVLAKGFGDTVAVVTGSRCGLSKAVGA